MGQGVDVRNRLAVKDHANELRRASSRSCAFRRIGIPTLAIEILSPSTARRDREHKRRIYLRAGVQEVWILDTKAQRIEVYTPEGGQTFTGGEEAVSTTVPGFRLIPEELFSGE